MAEPLKSQKKVAISPNMIRRVLKENGYTLADASRRMGYSETWMNQVLAHECMTENKLRLFCELFNCNESDVIAQPEKPDVQENSDTPDMYSVKLDVFQGKVKFTVLYEGWPLYSAYAGVRDNTELALVQAISYASHMCYKFAEQKSFKEEKNHAGNQSNN